MWVLIHKRKVALAAKEMTVIIFISNVSLLAWKDHLINNGSTILITYISPFHEYNNYRISNQPQ